MLSLEFSIQMETTLISRYMGGALFRLILESSIAHLVKRVFVCGQFIPFIIRADYSLKRWRDLTNIFDDSKQTAGSKNPLEEIFLATLGF